MPQQTLATLTAIDQQLRYRGVREFNALHVDLVQRSIYRLGMCASLSVPAGELEGLAQAGHIRWTSRGVGIDTFVLVWSHPQAMHA